MFKQAFAALSALLTVLSVFAVPAASAQPPGGPMMGDGMGMMGGGSGMMGGGMGMMGGMGTMGGMGPMGMLDLSNEQRTKINKISDELRKKQWEMQGKMLDEEAKLRDLSAADTRDPAAIGKVYGKIFDLRRQTIEAEIDARNRAEAVLTKEQREQMKQWQRGMGMGGRGAMGPGMMGPGGTGPGMGPGMMGPGGMNPGPAAPGGSTGR